MNREEMSRIAHAGHPIKSPLDDDSVGRLLERGLPRGDERVLDLGCGGGEWLLRALATRPHLYAEGVDISEDALAQAATAATGLGVQERLVLHHHKAEGFVSAEPFDVVLSFGSHARLRRPAPHSHRGPQTPGTRRSCPCRRGILGPPPVAEAIEMLGNFTDLATTVDRVVADGWTPVDGHVSTRRELDDYEWACWGSLAAWALDHPADPDSPHALETAAARRREWLHVYRDTWGFVSLALRRTPDRA